MSRLVIMAGFAAALAAGCAGKAVPRSYGDEVMDAVRGRMSPMKECYATAFVDDPSLEGRVRFTFTIDATGRVMSAYAENEGDRPLPASVTDCILEVLEATPFPPPEGEEDPTFAFPMTF
ncbi:MAG: AgmX/PglI C-terminal domain-containing protein [Deltaproteobacteria bacterium]|nr:AgmX/PglI C-terminal domain-containing protein [Deltaproteobacteria bacterium]